MASVYCFELKNVKEFPGRDGYGITASMYLYGKKIGTYEDYGDGGCEIVNYNTKKDEENMMHTIINFAKNYNNDFIINLYKERPQQFKEECERFKKYHPYIKDEDITIQTMASNSIVYIVEEFLKLYHIEKDFKKFKKKGYDGLAIKEDGSGFAFTGSAEKYKKDGYTIYMEEFDFVK
jgi:hypothetical protein